MAQPTPYDRQANFSNEEALNPTGKTPGASLDAEFNSVKVSLDQTQANLALIQRDDGALANGSVGLDQLADSLSVGFTLRGPWEAPENYVAGDGVTYDSVFYRALVSHLSVIGETPDTEPTLWLAVADFTDLAPAFIPDGSVTNAKLRNSLAVSVIGRSANSTGVPADITAGANDRVLQRKGDALVFDRVATDAIEDGALSADAPGRAKMADGFLTTALAADGLLSADSAGRAKTAALYTQPSMVSELAAPVGGRLTLTSGTPVIVNSVSAATAVYYAPYLHDALPLYNGTVWTWRQFSEMTLTLDATGHVTNSNYDVFAFDDSGTLRIGTGPVWTSATGRGSGAGTTELTRVAGRLTNGYSITLRNNSTNYSSIPANRALYLGTIRTGSAGQTNFVFGGSASGGTAASLGVWNAYNRVPVKTTIVDTGTSYTYNSNTLRAPRGGTGMRANFIIGWDEGGLAYEARATCGVNSGYYRLGIGLDSTSAQVANSSLAIGQDNTSINVDAVVEWCGNAGVGWHYLTTLESSDTVPTVVTFNAASSLNVWSQAIFEGEF